MDQLVASLYLLAWMTDGALAVHSACANVPIQDQRAQVLALVVQVVLLLSCLL